MSEDIQVDSQVLWITRVTRSKCGWWSCDRANLEMNAAQCMMSHLEFSHDEVLADGGGLLCSSSTMLPLHL